VLEEFNRQKTMAIKSSLTGFTKISTLLFLHIFSGPLSRSDTPVDRVYGKPYV